MQKNIFRIAVLQARSLMREYERNTQRVISEMEQARENHADLLLLPEAFITGYHLPISKEEAIDENSRYIKRLCEKAKELSIGVVATTFSKGIKKARNTAYLIDRQGRIQMKYDKVHTCDFSDEECLESGDSFQVCDFDGVKLGIMICYDREYPESARILMLKGAEIILVPNDCGSMAPRVQALSTRAYENMTGVVMANPPGKNSGNSCAFTPICWDDNGTCVDNTVFLADADYHGLLFADFDLERLRRYRNSEMMGNTFRKVAAYAKLLDATITEPFIR